MGRMTSYSTEKGNFDPFNEKNNFDPFPNMIILTHALNIIIMVGSFTKNDNFNMFTWNDMVHLSTKDDKIDMFTKILIVTRSLKWLFDMVTTSDKVSLDCIFWSLLPLAHSPKKINKGVYNLGLRVIQDATSHTKNQIDDLFLVLLIKAVYLLVTF